MKRFLVDTHCLLWSLHEPDRLNKQAREIFLNPNINLVISSVVSWEIAIKESLGKLTLPKPWIKVLSELFHDEGFSALSIEHGHAVKVSALPKHHNDPFDRLLIAQALTEDLPVLTSDRHFNKYDIDVIWAGD